MKIKDKLAGKKGHCPKCKAEFTIPGSSAEEEFLSLDDDDELVPDSPRPSSFEENAHARTIAGSSRTTDAYAESFKSTSNTAGDLLKQAAASTKNKNKKAQKLFGLDEREDPDRSRFDAGETFKYVIMNAVGPMLGIAALVMLVYWISSTVLKQSDLPPLGSVSGTVLLDNQPLPNAQITFNPKEDGDHKNTGSPSMGITNAQGQYVLMYLPRIRGAVLGKHRVEIRGQLTQTKDGVSVSTPVNQVAEFEVKKGANKIDMNLRSVP